jgi:hypothetical protein
MAVGDDPSQAYFNADFVNFDRLNAMYGCAFTQMAFDVQDILPAGQENAKGIATWLATYADKIPSQVSVVAFTGGPGVQTINIKAEMGAATYPFDVVGIVELYSTGSTTCLPSQSGCQVPTTVQAVLQNWLPGGACYADEGDMPIKKALQNQQGTWAGLSVEGQGCAGGCLISAVVPGHTCDAGGQLSFAQFSVAQFVQILQGFATLAKSAPAQPLNVMVYESAFLPLPWLTELGVAVPT